MPRGLSTCIKTILGFILFHNGNKLSLVIYILCTWHLWSITNFQIEA